MEPATEATRLLAFPNNNNGYKNSPEEVSHSQAAANVVATIFSCGWYAWSHSQEFNRAVAEGQLEAARFHLIKGAKVNLDNPSVQAVVANRESNQLKTFLVVNASSGNCLSTFQMLVNQGDYQNAELIAEEAPISLESRIAIFDCALQQQGKAAQIANRILGRSARLIVQIAKAVENYGLETLLPEIAQRESSCPFTRLYARCFNEVQVTWEGKKFVLSNYGWGPNEPPNMEQWSNSLLRKAIFFGNIPLVKDQLDNMSSNEVPPLDYLLDASKNRNVAEQVRSDMQKLLKNHPSTRRMGYPLF